MVLIVNFLAPVAQLDRAFDFGSKVKGSTPFGRTIRQIYFKIFFFIIKLIMWKQF